MIRHRGAREAPLFDLDETATGIVLAGDRDIVLWRGWLERDRADELYADIRSTTRWVRERRKMYDRFVDVPREQAWFGDDRERPFTPVLRRVRRELEAFAGARFAYVLLNRYRDGHDSVAWHHDREVEGMRAPTIASLTLGVTRAFDVRAIENRRLVTSVDLDHGDLIVMRGASQSAFEHRVKKDPRIAGERINLTFRVQPD